MMTTISTSFLRNYTSGSSSVITLSIDATGMPEGVSPFMDYSGFYDLAIGLLSKVMYDCDCPHFRGPDMVEHEQSFDFDGLVYTIKAKFQPTKETLKDSILTELAHSALLDVAAIIRMKLEAAHMVQQRKLATR